MPAGKCRLEAQKGEEWTVMMLMMLAAVSASLGSHFCILGLHTPIDIYVLAVLAQDGLRGYFSKRSMRMMRLLGILEDSQNACEIPL